MSDQDTGSESGEGTEVPTETGTPVVKHDHQEDDAALKIQATSPPLPLVALLAGREPVPWSKTTRDRWFFAALVLSVIAVALLFSPYVYVLLFSATTVVVTWPLNAWFRKKLGDRPVASALATASTLTCVVVGPLSLLLYLFGIEASGVASRAVEWVQSGDLDAHFHELEANSTYQLVESVIRDYLPEDFAPLKTAMQAVRSAALPALNAAGTAVPLIINNLVTGSIDSAIFVFTVTSLYIDGPRLLKVFMNLSPMDDSYERRLFHVFQEFSNNMVVGSLATACVQGFVAGLGYAVCGVDRVIFLSILTGVFSFVPMIGTLVIWGPVALYVAGTAGIPWAIGLALWNIVVTGSVDNVLKPLFLRGNTDIHPLLIFLAVFGGMAWLGLPGVLVGPIVVAFFLALYTIYCEDYLGIPSTPVHHQSTAELVEAFRTRMLRLIGRTDG